MTISQISSGGGVFAIDAPASASNRTITLPDASTTLVGTDATQTLTNKTIQGGALTLATAQASTSGTSIDFTGIPSWVKRITVLFSGVSKSGTANFLLQLGDSGGIENTGYTAVAIFAGASAVGATITSTSGFPTGGDASGSSVVNGTVTFVNITGNEWVCSLGLSVEGAYSCTGGGRKTLSATLDRVRITTTNGTDTFDAGTINIMYEG